MGWTPIILPNGTDAGYIWWCVWTTIIGAIAGFFGIPWMVPM